MIAIGVRLLHGWARAAGENDGALMGSVGTEAAEWPLSPARLFSALVAAGGSGEHRRVEGDDSELHAIERAAAPLIVADGPDDVLLTPLAERFVVIDKNQKGVVQNYPGRSSAVARPGVRIAPRHPELTYVWPDLELTDEQLRALRLRTARIGYLGASDAPADVRVVESVSVGATWTPDPDGEVLVAVPTEGLLERLDVAFEAFLAGQSLPGSTIRREVVAYRVPGRAETETSVSSPDAAQVLWFRLDRSLSGARTVELADATRGTVLAAFGDRGTTDEPPPVLHGHGLAEGVPRARYWTLPFVGPHGDGRIHGVCVALPESTDPAVVRRVAAALADASVRLPHGAERKLSRFANEPNSWSTNPRRWSGPSTVWTSATPVVFEQFRKGGPSAADVAAWCTNAGLPEPSYFEISKAPLIEGAVNLKPHQTTRKTGQVRPYGHVRVWFDAPVRGPFALGSMRSFGLGLMSPDVTERPAVLHPNSAGEETLDG